MIAIVGPDYWRAFNFTSDSGGLELQQVDRKHFILRSRVEYNGPLGIDVSAADEKVLRVVEPGDGKPGALGCTDLASVPAPFRWWASPYGRHTPAALIHDRFIGPAANPPGRPDGVTEQQVDTYFREMLRQSDVRFFRRWLMWAAVASRTRLADKGRRQVMMICWLALALAGVVCLWWGLRSDVDWAVALGLLLPVPTAGLWGTQWPAGLIIAYIGVPFLLGPALLAVPLLLLFTALEKTWGQLFTDVRTELGGKDTPDFPG